MEKKSEKVKELCRQFMDGEIRIDQFTDALEKEGMNYYIGYVLHDLQREVWYLTNVGKLDEEDQKIAAQWRQEHKDRRKVYDLISKAEKANDKDEMIRLMNTIQGPSQCPHERSIWSPCSACDHIERTLYPGMHTEDENDE